MGNTTREVHGPPLARAYTPEEERASTTVDRQARTINVIASTEAVDSFDTRILTSGWDLKRYAKNPIVLLSHDSKNIRSVAGTADVKANGKRLEATIRFLPVGKNEDVDLAFDMYTEGVMRGVSVGFMPRKWHDETTKEGRSIRVFDEQELVELSLVPVPANEEALARELREWGNTSQPSTTAEEPIMADKQDNGLPPAIAEKLGVDNTEAAVAKIVELQLSNDALQRRAETAEATLAEVTKSNEERAARERETEVDALIAAQRLPADKREQALLLLAANAEAFRAIYPVQKADVQTSHLLRQVVPNPPKQEAVSHVEGKPDGKSAFGKVVEDVVREWTDAKREFYREEAYAEAYDRLGKLERAQRTAI